MRIQIKKIKSKNGYNAHAILVNEKKIWQIEDYDIIFACSLAYTRKADKVFEFFFFDNAVERKFRKKLSDKDRNKLRNSVQKLIDIVHKNPCKHVIKTRTGEKDAYQCIDLDTYKCKLCGKVHRV